MNTQEFINPNLHVILIHYPLGLLTVGTLIELFAFLWRRSAFRAAGRWMILLGALSLAPVATSGLYAMADVNRPPGTPDDTTWADARHVSPIKGEAWEMMTEHAWYNAAASAVLLLTVVLWLGSSDLWRRRLHLPFLVLLLFGMAIMISAAWHGGEMVYRYGVGVERLEKPRGTIEAGTGKESVAGEAEADVKHGVAFYVDPLQTHVILAGTVVSLALAALGLSLRAGAQAKVLVEPTPELADVHGISAALNPSARPYAPGGAATTAGALNAGIADETTMQVTVIRRPPVVRFWLLATLAAIVTALTGWWTLGYYADVFSHDYPTVGEKVNRLWALVANHDEAGGYRRFAHSGTGIGIVGVLLLMTIVGRWASARRFVLMLLTTLLLAAVAAQVWFGSLLMFDTNVGALGQFNSALGATSQTDNTTPEVTGEPVAAPSKPVPAPTSAPAATTSPADETPATPAVRVPVPELPATVPAVPATLPAAPAPATVPAVPPVSPLSGTPTATTTSPAVSAPPASATTTAPSP